MNRNLDIKPVHIGLRSRLLVWLIRVLLKPLIRWRSGAAPLRIIEAQVMFAGRLRSPTGGMPLDYRVLNGVPGPVLGDLRDTGRPAILYLHGGGFLVPAIPQVHVNFLSRLCRELGAVGFMPDYRLAPLHKFPAALDDCERAYRALLAAGFAAERIVVAGESAGGNLCLGLLQRIRKAGLPMPACAVPISAVTEMARVHAPPSRGHNAQCDPMIPLRPVARMLMLYAGGLDGADPELSPIYADFSGFPPLYFLVAATEVLLDDTLIVARRAQEAGVETQLDVWPVLPHAFPLFGRLFPEVDQARRDIVTFIGRQLQRVAAADPASDSLQPALRKLTEVSVPAGAGLGAS